MSAGFPKKRIGIRNGQLRKQRSSPAGGSLPHQGTDIPLPRKVAVVRGLLGNMPAGGSLQDHQDRAGVPHFGRGPDKVRLKGPVDLRPERFLEHGDVHHAVERQQRAARLPVPGPYVRGGRKAQPRRELLCDRPQAPVCLLWDVPSDCGEVHRAFQVGDFVRGPAPDGFHDSAAQGFYKRR